MLENCNNEYTLGMENGEVYIQAQNDKETE